MSGIGKSNDIAKNRGTFIVFEGLDRCGKSTQSKMLHDYLNETKTCEAMLVRFPGILENVNVFFR